MKACFSSSLIASPNISSVSSSMSSATRSAPRPVTVPYVADSECTCAGDIPNSRRPSPSRGRMVQSVYAVIVATRMPRRSGGRGGECASLASSVGHPHELSVAPADALVPVGEVQQCPALRGHLGHQLGRPRIVLSAFGTHPLVGRTHL